LSAAGIELATQRLSFTYPDGTPALAGVTLTISPSTRVAIIGQNGSGKSTLIRHFNGLLRPTDGEVLIDGRAVGTRHVAELARLVGISFQNPDRQIFAARAKSEVGFGLRNFGLRGRELDDRVSAALDQVGLTGQLETNPYDLGYSERKLLALASVVALQTPAVVLDEPTTGQDANGIRRVKQIVDDLSQAGRTVIAVSHDMEFVANSFERVVVMRAGRVVLDGSPAEVFAEGSWPTLRSTNLEPTHAATVGARFGLGSTPTQRAVIDALLK
jgi:energy-coupling factor transport system ATP-binding protein